MRNHYRDNHAACPGGCNELADECMCRHPNPLGSMQVSGWSVRSQSCPDDYDPSWHSFGSRSEAEAFVRAERRENPTDILEIIESGRVGTPTTEKTQQPFGGQL